MKPLSLILLTVLPLSAAPVLARKAPPAQLSNAGNRPDSPAYVHVHDSDKAMHQAVHQAQQSMGKFMAALTKPQPGQTGFAVKKRCIEGKKCEHIWLADVRFDGRVLRGKVDNDPVDIKSLRVGQKVTVLPGEVSDWMYVENGRLVGGYTVRAYYRNLPADQKRRFAQNVGFRVD
jgi:uncharacterized protein YegJ (DUF2314 family)